MAKIAKASGAAKNALSAPTKRSEITGIFLILLAIIIVLALVSYNALDSSINSVSPYEPMNFIGRVGAFLAETLFTGLGYSAYWLPILLVIVSYFYFTNRRVKIRTSQIIGFAVFLASSSSFIRLMTGVKPTIESGGVVGMVLGDSLSGLFGWIGTVAIVVALFFVSLVFTIDMHFAAMGRVLIALASKLSGGLGLFLDEKFGKSTKKAKVKTDSNKELIIHAEKSYSADNDQKEIYTEPVIQVQSALDDTAKKPITISDGISDSNVKVGTAAPKAEPATQIEFTGFKGNYKFPEVHLLEDHTLQNIKVEREELVNQSRVLESKLESFKIEGKVIEVHPGPVITMFEFEPASGIKVSQIANRDDDLAMALRAESIRIVAPIPGKGSIGIEVPNQERQIVSVKELIESEKFQSFTGRLPVVLGKDIGGRVRVADLAAMPHLLVAGTTGAGKSVFLNTIICSLLYRCSPSYLRMLMVDPKMLELSDYASIPHLLYPVVTDPRKAAVILKWAVTEMEERYRKMAEMGVRNIDNYNHKIERIHSGKAKRPSSGSFNDSEQDDLEPLEKMPYILIIIDELSDLMIVAAKEVQESITRLAQMARAAGLHLVMATQRPSVDVITGVIKANFPARISFKVSSRIDSRTILDQQGSENLLGNGDMLFMPPTSSKIERIHGALVTEGEIQRVVEVIGESGGPQYDQKIVRAGEHADDPGALGGGAEAIDEQEQELIEDAWEIIRRERKASISYIQRRMKIGYNKAARIIEALELRGFIAPSDGTSRPREILIPPEDGSEDFN